MGSPAIMTRDDPPAAAGAPSHDTSPARLRAIVDAHFDFIWRSLRRLGVAEHSVDDAAQQVWIVAARKLAAIPPGQERAFLFGTALRVASDARRSTSRRREVLADVDDDGPIDHAPHADQQLDDRRARALLDDVLEALPIDLRAVFVLFELEELPVAEIAALVGIPVGTASSRLRRARAEFQQIIKRLRARGAIPGGER
jgi:RNA polymerase sigma-70 factor, ECF subfamily